MAKHRNTLWNIVAASGGVLAGVAASRLLPPLTAQLGGAMRAKMGGDPFERLIADHRRIRSLLDRMEHTPERSRARRAKLYLQLKRTLAKHAMAEEDIVYPVLVDQAGEQQAGRHLYDEHADMKIHLYHLEQLLMSGGDWSDRVRSLRDLVVKHIRDEEDVHFPKLRQYLGQRRTADLSRNIRREEALVL